MESDVPICGLTEAEARQMRETGGGNTPPPPITKSAGQIIRENVCTLFNLFNVLIAIALACDPDLLICDEPPTALDVTIQAKILELIRSIQRERGISVIYITHDLGVVAKVADYVDVMYAGKIVETGTIDEIFYEPRHPYTWGLLSAMPDLDTADDRLYTIPGSPPNLLHEKQGDAFAPRNHFALNIDDEVDPPMFKISDTHYAATWLLDPRAPKVDMPPELAQRIARMRAEAEKIKEAE